MFRDPIGERAFLEQYSQGKSLKDRRWLRQQALNQPYLFSLNDPVDYHDGDGAVPVLLIWSVGKAVSHGILACYSCTKLYQCLDRAKELGQQAAAGLPEAEDYINWLNAAKPGSECVGLAKECGVEVIQVAVWLGARYLVLKQAHYG